ncbi:MAG: tRNA (adenosine(37)-N6)-dimethylallyltransferase MiaA [Victivallaceae bacterium]|nr:tRNA (adenosine(37)-N6)-dimethylallyltransferase MiaA [Victivallaceae bacterium]
MKILVIIGPTASGKSALALETARERNGEIVSADSMQLYCGLEIGTAQPTEKERAGIAHHLVGCFPFGEKVDVYRYVKLADAAIRDISARGKLPILCGGTGFYVKALLRGLDELPGDDALRRKLDELYDSDAGYPALIEEMARRDPAALEKWRFCRRKLIRALEVVSLCGKSILELQTRRDAPLRYEAEAYRIERSPEALRARIAERAEKMLASGWIEEARSAIAAGLLESPTAWQAIGYADIGRFLRGEFDRKTLLEKIVSASCRYARRQRTWFRHQHPEAKVLAF